MGGIPLKQNDMLVSKYGNIYLEPSAEYYYPGDTVTGSIYLKLHSRFPGKTIQLRIKGKETIWSQQSTSSPDYIHEKNLIFDKRFNINLETQTDELEAGQYQIPFSFLLPQGISSTFSHVELRLAANTSYTISTALLPKECKTSSKFSYKRPLLVHETPYKAEDMAGYFPMPVKSCWSCINHGFSLITVTLNKHAFFPSQEIQIEILIDNTKCSKNIRNLTLELKHLISIKGKDVSQSRNYVIAQKSTEIGTLAHQLSELISISFLLPKVAPFDPYESMDFNKVKDKALKNSDELGCTTKGLLVQSEFFVEITANVEGSCMSTTPRFTFPLQILHPDYDFPKLEIPKNWNPTLQPVVNLVIDLSPQYSELSMFKKMMRTSSMGSSMKMSTSTPKKIHIKKEENSKSDYIFLEEPKMPDSKTSRFCERQ